MTAIVGVRGRPGGQRRRTRRARCAAPLVSTRSGSTALKTLDFDKLTRNAQVDYLFIKRTSEVQIARAKTPVQTELRERRTRPASRVTRADVSGCSTTSRTKWSLTHPRS